MYPNRYFNLFPSTPIEPQVFVAMAFDERHNQRWETVIRPAIKDVNLKPYRVDASRVSDSILTEILQGIGTSKIIFVEVSLLDGNRKPNVMYELGIAHATRDATEVVIFRDDDALLPFDVANVRVNQYEAHPDDNPEKARESVRFALADALREFDLSKSMAVQIAMQRLDQASYNLLLNAIGKGGVIHPHWQNIGQAVASADTLRALTILLELRLLTPEYPDIYDLVQKLGEPELEKSGPLAVTYKSTELGKAVMENIALQYGGQRLINDADLFRQVEQYFKDKQP